MNFSFILADNTPSSADTTQSGGNIILIIVYFAIIVAALYFLMIRPNKKKQKEEKKMRESLMIGDEILTIGGIYGRVISLKEDTIVIESKSDHSKLTVARWALQQNLTVHDDGEK